ncbi:hypothetical protein EPO14_03605 [Patescibacteria group bacterium]|nr:MAG: hypothetical protein EPO14_03605 [Patescibacteria group bacterium]
MDRDQELRKRIMRRVYGLYVVRQLTSPMVRFAALATVFFALASSVSLPHVVQNALNVEGISGLINFVVVAIVGTTLVVQLCVLVAVLLTAWIGVDVVRRAGNTQLSVQ